MNIDPGDKVEYAFVPERGADLMSKNYAEVEIAEDADGTEILPLDDSASKSSLASGGGGLDRRRRSSLAVGAGWRSRSVVVQRLPVQEAMKNGNSKNYFNALRRLDFASLAQNWTPQENEEFLTTHLIVSESDFLHAQRTIDLLVNDLLVNQGRLEVITYLLSSSSRWKEFSSNYLYSS